MIAAALAAICRLISGATVEWHCDPQAEVQRIYFANHSSHLDFIVIWSALSPALRPFARPVAGRDYWDRGALRRYLANQVFRAVLIERRSPDSVTAATGADAVQRMADEMRDRNSLIVFPEGTRSVNGQIGAFKSGLYHLARTRPQAELVPVHLQNLNRILPKGEILPVPMLSRVVFGPRLLMPQHESKDEFLTRARAAVIALGARQ